MKVKRNLLKPFCVVLLIAFAAAIFVGCTTDSSQTGEQPAKEGASNEESVPQTQDEQPKKQLVIGKIPITLANLYHQSDVEHFKKYAMEEYGAEVVVIDGKMDSATTVAALDQMLIQNVDAISVHSIDAESVIPGLKEAVAAGIPVITFYTKPSEEVCPHVQINEKTTSKQMGVLAAKKWKEFYPDIPIKVGLVEYVNVPIPIEHRSEPFIEGVLSVDPSAEIVSRLDGGATRETAMAACQDMLQAHPDVNIIYGTSSDYSLGCLAALEAAGRGKAKDGVPLTEILVGTDAPEAELIVMFDPSCSFKITQGLTPIENAKTKVDTLMRILNGELNIDSNEVIDTFNVMFDYWNSSIDEVQGWLEEQYFSEVDLKEELAKRTD